MNTSLLETLHTAALYTFERLVFVLPDVPPDEIQRRQPVHAVATIAFSGPTRGVFQLHAAEGLLPRLAANMLGTESSNETLQLDALGELANIICGQVLPSLHEQSAFQQRPPEVVTGATVMSPEAAPSARVELGIESSRVDLLLYLYPGNGTASAP